MKQKLLQVIKKFYKDIITVIIIFIAVTLFLIHYYDINNLDFNIPFRYVGTDEMCTLVEAKMVKETGWNVYTDRLAAPYGFDNANNIISGMHNMDTLTTKLFIVMTGNYVAGINLTFISAFYFISLIAYIVLRNLKIREYVSACGALDFALLPFIFLRNEEHLVLSCYYFIPLAILLCIWIYEDDKFLVFDKNSLYYKKNWAAIFMTFLIANSGIIYWQFFGCFFLCVTAFANVLRHRKVTYIWKSVFCIVSIIIFMLLGCIPEIIDYINGGSGITGRLRSIPDAELYGMKFIQLILPVRGHGISALENIIKEYNETAPLVTENDTSYIGFIGILGLIILLSVIFVYKNDKDCLDKRRLCILSELNISAILMGTIGGLGSCFFVFITRTLRCFNRISVYIAFLCITAVCITINHYVDRIKTKVKYLLTALVVVIIFVAGIKEQNPDNGLMTEERTVEWENDKEFIGRIEESVEEGAMIYQLPYHKYPEGGIQVEMQDFELFKGYLHSDKLKWSFGISYGTTEDEWDYNTANMDASNMIEELLEKGYSGIYIVRDGYEYEDVEELEKQLSDILGIRPIESLDGTISFYKLK